MLNWFIIEKEDANLASILIPYKFLYINVVVQNRSASQLLWQSIGVNLKKLIKTLWKIVKYCVSIILKMGRASKYKKLDNSDTLAAEEHDEGLKKVRKFSNFSHETRLRYSLQSILNQFISQNIRNSIQFFHIHFNFIEFYHNLWSRKIWFISESLLHF